ncbi:CLIP domain-containing serine protease B9-like isoform X1 [Culex pipiens pallens]|uniref:CLIP domain-containing serine protease B9-like isoform X1 n=1 Tax=Culex pipiens pallens TaxID=42434 RepID=UPI0022AAFE5F|nr:CLIP domain-containing serine protease B9-like isoform X1 [Culex pipiens pallens]
MDSSGRSYTDFRSSMAGDVNFVTGFGRTLKGSRDPIKQKQGIKVYDQERSRAKFATKNGDMRRWRLCQGDSGGPLMKLQMV